LYTVADKYETEVVMGLLRDVLMHRFMDAFPIRVYALASRWGFEEISKITSTKTLAFNIFKELSKEDAELTGGAACLQLFLLHSNRREAARYVVANHARAVDASRQITAAWFQTTLAYR
jgi:hypothetical protein